MIYFIFLASLASGTCYLVCHWKNRTEFRLRSWFFLFASSALWARAFTVYANIRYNHTLWFFTASRKGETKRLRADKTATQKGVSYYSIATLQQSERVWLSIKKGQAGYNWAELDTTDPTPLLYFSQIVCNIPPKESFMRVKQKMFPRFAVIRRQGGVI